MELTLFVCRLRVACNEATIYSRMPRREGHGTDPMGGIDTRGYQGRMEQRWTKKKEFVPRQESWIAANESLLVVRSWIKSNGTTTWRHPVVLYVEMPITDTTIKRNNRYWCTSPREDAAIRVRSRKENRRRTREFWNFLVSRERYFLFLEINYARFRFKSRRQSTKNWSRC